MKTRQEALQLLHEYTQSESLRRHAYAVEAAMRAYAAKFDEDVELWGMTGLLHDFDYERFPTPSEHTVVGSRILREKGYSEEIIHAIAGHTNHHDVLRDSLLAKTLYACDEISGFVMAVAMVRPTRSIESVEVKSVKKKLKDKAFAKGVNRDDVYGGAQELGVSLDEHIALVIQAQCDISSALGLDGAESAS